VVSLLVASAPRSFWAQVSLAENYSLYRGSVCPPHRLGEFDAYHGLSLTEDEAAE
jgi:hypothetical protein